VTAPLLFSLLKLQVDKPARQVFVVVAGDLTSRQQQILDHEYPDFKPGPHQTMVELGVQLPMWMRTEIDGEAGFGGSILGATNDERFKFEAMPPSTTEEIADRIVFLWVRKACGF
jgi:hypothetical protein